MKGGVEACKKLRALIIPPLFSTIALEV